jgi:uncharacterized protein YndB with AHSA1/START domain
MTGTTAVDVTVLIPAAPADVFGFLTDPARYVEWMGSEATLNPVPGGEYRIRMPDGFEAAGEFLDVEQPHRVAFTWGFADDDAARRTKNGNPEAVSAAAMPAGSTRVVVTLSGKAGGTQLTLRHENLPSPELCEGHRVAWQTYLGRLAIRAAGQDPGPDPHS